MMATRQADVLRILDDSLSVYVDMLNKVDAKHRERILTGLGETLKMRDLVRELPEAVVYLPFDFLTEHRELQQRWADHEAATHSSRHAFGERDKQKSHLGLVH